MTLRSKAWKALGAMMFVVGVIMVVLSLWGSALEFESSEASEGALPLLSLWWITLPLAAILMVVGVVMFLGRRSDEALPPADDAPQVPPAERDP